MSWNVQDSIEIGLTHVYEHSPGEAYECFTSALNLEPNNETALRYRAQVAMQLYDKRRDTALDDIEAAIRASPFKGELYLLENEILLSKNQYPEALKRLKKAPFKVFHNDPNISKLRALYEKQVLAELNHIVKMPTEVIYGILIALPLSSRVKCLAVSRQWRDMFSRISDLWRDLDYYSVLVSHRNRQLTMPSLYPYNTYHYDHNQLVRTPVHYSEGSIAASLDLFMRWADVRKLRIPLTNSVIEQLVQRRPGLTEVAFMGGMIVVDPLVLELMMREIGSTWRKVEFDSTIKPFAFAHSASMYCPALTELTIHQGHWHHNMPASLARLLRPIPSLTTLRLSHCDFSTMFPIISQLCPELTELTVEGSDQIMFMTPNFYSMLRSAKKLKRLTLRDRYATSAANLTSFIRDHQLECLDINDFPITREGMLALVDAIRQKQEREKYLGDERSTSMTLKCYDRQFVLDQPETLAELKHTVDEKQPARVRVVHYNLTEEEEDDEEAEEDEEEDEEARMYAYLDEQLYTEFSYDFDAL